MVYQGTMTPFVFRCPTTGQNVQGQTYAEPPAEGQPKVYEVVTCLACQRSHLVNPHTGKLLSEESKGPS